MLSRSEAMSEVMWHLVRHDAHGYSQPARAGDGTEEEVRLSDGERVIVHGGDYDCSEAVRVAVDCALSGSHYGPIAYMWTGNERDALLSVGFEEVSPWKARNGDVLLRKGHTEMVIARDGALTQAGFRQSETGGIRGKKGDQTGREATYSGFRPEAWQMAFRYAGPEKDAPQKKEAEDMQQVFNNGGEVYRLYNPYSGAHHFTTSAGERDSLKAAGWQYEGVAWTAQIGQFAVYRLYNPNSADHLLTTNFGEAKSCADAGWQYEGVPFMATPSGTEVYRLYNPYAGQHMYTASRAERDSLEAAGWRAESGFCV